MIAERRAFAKVVRYLHPLPQLAPLSRISARIARATVTHSTTANAIPSANASPAQGPARGARLLPLAVGVIFAALYAVFAAPGIVTLFDDTLEFQLVLPTAGIAHPTGYPLYTLLGFVWSRLLFPVGEWAWRVNLLSALFAGAAVGVVCALTQRLARKQGGRAWASAVAGVCAALAFGLGATWWVQATVAEVYALHLLLVALILWLALCAGDAPAARQPRLVIALASLCGLALTHHRTAVLLFPGLALYLLWSVPALRRPGRLWLLCAGALLLPLLLYAYMPLRAAMGVRDLNGSYLATWQGFWDHVLARRYGAFFSANALSVARTPGDWLTLAAAQMGLLVAALGLLGFLLGLLRAAARPAWLLIALTLVANLLFALAYRVGDVEVFLLPVWLCLAVGFGALVQSVAAWAGRGRSGRWLGALGATALVAIAALGLGGRTPSPPRAGWAVHDYALALTSPRFAPGSQVLGLEGEMTAIRYMQAAHARALAAAPVVANDEAQRRTLLAAAVASGAPAYVTRELPGIEQAYSFGGEGALVRVYPRGAAQPPAPQSPAAQSFANSALLLTGYDLGLLDGSNGRTVDLALYWQPQAPLTQELKLSLRVVDAAGETLPLAAGSPAQQDLFPLRMLSPTTAWLPGEVVRDAYQIELPPAVEGARILAIVYDSATLAEVGRWEAPVPGAEHK